jgi:hypothetical protein
LPQTVLRNRYNWGNPSRSSYRVVLFQLLEGTKGSLWSTREKRCNWRI